MDSANLRRDDLLKLERQLCFGLAVASRSVISAYKPVLDPLGLTHPQYLVMLALWESAPIGARELSEKLHLDPGTLSPLVKRLEKAGLLERRKNPRDERAIIIETTERGKELREQALNVPSEMMNRLNLSEQKVVELCEILSGVVDAGIAAPTA
ncbi:MarR family winged helix-turn-helix transcriptional regulator [Glutamicibacter arilaitensis]|uniref:MarR family winged helix-turn-helix transcriptional regulator n=1 Tax=Glutamicibacter arilaitensis TaxID=256701 RepID=UPI00384A8A56